MKKKDKVQKAQKEIVKVGRILLEKKLVAGTWGNISVFLPKEGKILITPSGSNYLKLQAEDIIVLNMNAEIIAGKGKPSSELALHHAIYKNRQDFYAIVHTHSVYASACAVARLAVPSIIEDLVMIAGGEVAVAEYALAGTEKLALNAVEALGNKRAVLLANHGVVGCGTTLSEAVTVCEVVEKTAKIFIAAKQLGGINILGNNDIRTLQEKYNTVYGCYQR